MTKKLAIVLVLFLVGFAYLYFGGYLGAIYGSTVISLQQATFTIDDVEGERWILTTIAGGWAQNYYGDTNPAPGAQGIEADVVGQMSGHYPDHDLFLEIFSTVQTCEWPIIYQMGVTPVHDHYIEENVDCNQFLTLNERCDNTALGNPVQSGRWAGTFTCFCVYEDQETDAIDPFVTDQTFHTVSDINVQAAGQSYSTIFDNFDDVQGDIGPYVDYTYLGSVVLEDCPLSVGGIDMMAYYSEDYDEWRINEKTEYDDYNIKKLTLGTALDAACDIQDIPFFLDACHPYENPANGEPGIYNIINDINGQSSLILDLPLDLAEEQGVGLNGARVIKDVNTAVSAPIFTFIVDADFVGIYQPSPDIRPVGSCQGNEISGQGTVSIDLHNYGETGNAWVSLTCPDGSDITVQTPTQQVGVLADGDATVYFSVSSTTETVANCEIIVDDGTEEISSCVITGHPPQGVCNEGEKRCDYILDQVEICQDNTWVLFEECTGDLTCTVVGPGDAVCQTMLPTCGNGQCDQGETAENCPQDCGGWNFPITPEIMILILIPIVLGVLGYALRRDKAWAIFGAVIGAIISIVLWIIYTSILAQILLVLFGIAITALMFYGLGAIATIILGIILLKQ